MSPKDIPTFYKAMEYPAPKNLSYYYYINESQENKTAISHVNTEEFSRNYKTERMKLYETFINKHSKIFRSIPFVSQVYICNSMSFNALHEGSDIDILIITKPGYIRLARRRSRIYVFFMKLKRTSGLGDHAYKLCLSFYLDAHHANLLSLRQSSGDIYLSYRVAHNVLLYTDHKYPDDHIFRHNQELLSYLPSHPQTQTIFLDIDVIRGSSYRKKIMEALGSTWFGKLIQHAIRLLRGGLLNHYKNKKLSRYQQQHIIVSNTILKFHNDKRALYHKRRKDTTNNK